MSINNKLKDFKKAILKKNITIGLTPVRSWASFPSLGLNYIATGTFDRGIPSGRTTCFAGPSGSGKSLILGNIAKELQNKGYTIIYIDTEHAIDEEFLGKIGVSLDEDFFLPISISTIEECTDTVSNILSTFNKDDKIAIILDSASNMETALEEEKFEKGELSNDFGLFAKKLKQLVKNVNAKIGGTEWYFLYSLHVYLNKDFPNDGRGKYIVSGGESQLFLPSLSIMLDKLNLKEGSDQIGIRMKAQTLKTRFNSLGKKCEIMVPYETGIDRLSGVLEILEKHEIVKKNGGWYSYEKDGEVLKFQKSNFSEHSDWIIENLCDDIKKFHIEELDEAEQEETTSDE